MTNDEINIAIAEYRNWRNIKEIDYQPFGTDPYIDGPDQMLVGIHPESDSDEYEAIPNYCNDLNEMHEAEKFLEGSINWNKYTDILGKLRFYNPEIHCVRSFANIIVSAPAKERAKAFVKTIGKWEN